jgi:hypothetical protein
MSDVKKGLHVIDPDAIVDTLLYGGTSNAINATLYNKLS